MSRVHLQGYLACRDDSEVRVVRQHLDRHIQLTGAEPGCISFEAQTDGPLVWNIDEWFASPHDFRAHQDRSKDSAWGQATAGMDRRYTTEEVRP